MNRLEFGARLIVIYVAGALSAIGADGNITAPFAILSLFLTTELLARRADRDGVDRAARVVGSLIVSLVLGGLVLTWLPDGLTRQSWSAFWVVLSLLVLWVKRRERTSFAWLHRRAGSQTAWFGAALAVVALASVLAVHGANKDLQSPLQMWVQGKSPGSVTVAISSGHAEGPYRLVVSPEVTKTNAFDPFSVAPGAAVERGIPVGSSTRYDIHLVEVQTGSIVRTVIVDSPPIS